MNDKSLFKLQLKKFGFLVYYGLKKRIWTKAFLIANIIIFLLSLFITVLPNFFKETIESDYKISIVINKDDPKVIENSKKIIEENNNSNNIYYKYNISEIIKDEKQATVEKQLERLAKESNYRAILIFTVGDQVDYHDLKLDVVHTNLFKKNNVENLKEHFKSLILKINNKTTNPYLLNIETKSVTYKKDERKQTAKIVALVILLTTTFTIMFLSNMLGTEIIKEKETKAVEIILTSITPKIHFLSKITSLLLFLLFQVALIFINFSITALLLGKGLSESQVDLTQLPILSDNLLSSTIIFMLGFGFIGLITMLFLTGIIASMSNNFEEYQSAITPISFLTFIPAYLVFFLIEQTNFLSEITLKIFSYVPIFSTFIAPVTYFAGLITWYEALISLILSILFLVGLIFVFSPVYKKNILNYSKSKFLSKMTSFFRFKKGNN